MSVSVRVQNFQSIEDETLVIDGLTVITGPNNSGKTAILRATKGVFTNAPAGPLVRHGAAHLTVTIAFDDGTEIVWEKGWEKPGRKGKTVNRYKLNGTWLKDVGRGVPPEIAALGVGEIAAGSDRIWPQVADQFDGALFLINRPGAAVAEALSDVERVGKLTAALKLAEKDRRSNSSELKVRRSDRQAAKDDVAVFDGLEAAADQVRGVSQEGLTTIYGEWQETQQLSESYNEAFQTVGALHGFKPELVPAGEQAQKIRETQSSLQECERLYARFQSAQGTVTALHGFDGSSVPDEGKLRRLQQLLRALDSLLERLQKVQEETSALQGFQLPSFPDSDRPGRIHMGLGRAEALLTEYDEAYEKVRSLTVELVKAERAAKKADDLVITHIGEQGYCPTCNTVHTPQGAA
jgi:exonuclease SbcC